MLVEIEDVPFEHHRVGGVSFMTDGTTSESACVLEKLNKGIKAVRASNVLTSLAAGKNVDPVELTATFDSDESCTRSYD